MAIPWLAIAQVGASILGGIAGNKQQQKQTQLAEMQAAQQNEIMRKQLELAEKMNRQGLATQIDALGNITWYDESKNQWQTILAPKQQELQDLSDREQRQQLAIDAPMNRAENIKNATTRSKEGMVGETMRMGIEDLLRTGGVKGSDLASSMRLSRERAVTQGFDDISNAVLTSALRTGSSGASSILSNLARQRSKEIARTLGEPDIEGLTLAQDINQSDMAARLNAYNLMQGRASNNPIMNFNPVGIGQSASGSLANSRNAAATAGGYSGNLLSGAGALASRPITPDYKTGGNAALLGSIANLLGAAGGGGDPVAAIGNWIKNRRAGGGGTNNVEQWNLGWGS